LSCQRISAKDTENYVSKVPKLYKEITQQLRKTILDNFPHLNEAIKWGNPVYYTDENLFYVSANKDHVKLGFFLHGPDLDDPDGLIEGTGAKMRYVKYRNLNELNEKQIVEWIRQLLKLVEND